MLLVNKKFCDPIKVLKKNLDQRDSIKRCNVLTAKEQNRLCVHRHDVLLFFIVLKNKVGHMFDSSATCVTGRTMRVSRLLVPNPKEDPQL